MKIDIYTSAVNGSKYLSVAKGTKLDSLAFTSELDSDLTKLSPFRTRLELDAGKDHNALDQADILQQIEQRGYAIHGAKQTIELEIKS